MKTHLSFGIFFLVILCFLSCSINQAPQSGLTTSYYEFQKLKDDNLSDSIEVFIRKNGDSIGVSLYIDGQLAWKTIGTNTVYCKIAPYQTPHGLKVFGVKKTYNRPIQLVELKTNSGVLLARNYISTDTRRAIFDIAYLKTLNDYPYLTYSWLTMQNRQSIQQTIEKVEHTMIISKRNYKQFERLKQKSGFICGINDYSILYYQLRHNSFDTLSVTVNHILIFQAVNGKIIYQAKKLDFKFEATLKRSYYTIPIAQYPAEVTLKYGTIYASLFHNPIDGIICLEAIENPQGAMLGIPWKCQNYTYKVKKQR